jgi:zinc transporter 1
VRAEVVGALINGVFLLAVCFSITIDSIGRFADIEEIKDPEPVAHKPNARLSH